MTLPHIHDPDGTIRVALPGENACPNVGCRRSVFDNECTMCGHDPATTVECSSPGCPTMEVRRKPAPLYRHIVELSFDDPSPTEIDLWEMIGPPWPERRAAVVYLADPERRYAPVLAGQRRRRPPEEVASYRTVRVLATVGEWAWCVREFTEEGPSEPVNLLVATLERWEVIE